MQPEAYPESFPDLPKLDLLKRQAEALGVGNKFYRVPQTTRFQDGPNSTGVEMQASALTGNDSTGINDGSKSSTLVNYLSDAWNWGAEMLAYLVRLHTLLLIIRAIASVSAKFATSRKTPPEMAISYFLPGTEVSAELSRRTYTVISCGSMQRNLSFLVQVL